MSDPWLVRRDLRCAVAAATPLRVARASAKALDPGGQELGTCVAGLLRVELGGAERTVLHGRDERSTVVGPGDGGRHERGVARLEEREAPRGIGVHEVEPFVLDAAEKARRRRGLDRGPAHVRHCLLYTSDAADDLTRVDL